jgi:hypothetical protein
MTVRDQLAALRHFDVDKEFRCPCGRATCDAPVRPHRILGLYLDRTRELFGSPLVVTSGNRCATHNAAVGGEPVSEHVRPDGCTVSPYTAPDLVDRIAREISDHISGTKHPDGVAPVVLAEHLVAALRDSHALWTAEDLERVGDHE